MSYEDTETHWFHNCPIRSTSTEAADIDRQVKGWPASLKLEELRARVQWAYYNGTEDRCAELDAQICLLELELYDKVKQWSVNRIPEGC